MIRFFAVGALVVGACTSSTDPTGDPCALVGALPDASCPAGCQVFTASVADTTRGCVLPESRVVACGEPDVSYSGGLTLTCFEHPEASLAFIHTMTGLRDYEDESAPDRLEVVGWQRCPEGHGFGDTRLELPACE